MARREHSYEQMAQDLNDWIEATAQKLAGGMFEGDAAPGAATLTRDEQLDYYEGLLFTPEGGPNIPGRQRFVGSLGPAEQKKVTDALLRRHGDRQKEMTRYG